MTPRRKRDEAARQRLTGFLFLILFWLSQR